MLNLFTRPPLDNSNTESPEEQSSINLDFKASINIKGKVLMKVLLLLLLGGSVFGGGLANSISSNNPSNTESVDQSSK